MIRDGNVFCDNCGRKLGPNDNVCPNCGTQPSFVNIPSSPKTNITYSLSMVVLILGIIGSIYLAYKFGVKVDSDYSIWTDKYKYETVRDWPSTISIFVSGSFSTFILYTILSTLSSISEKLDELCRK